TTSDPGVLACMDTNAKALLKYGTSANKCQTKCENDYSTTASKGGGGPTNSTTQCALTGGVTTVFNLCVQAARDKLDAAAVDGTAAHNSACRCDPRRVRHDAGTERPPRRREQQPLQPHHLLLNVRAVIRRAPRARGARGAVLPAA